VNGFLIGFVSLLFVAGCANTGAVGTAQQVAEGGQKYISTLQKVNALALDHSLDFTANLLPNLPRNAATLEEQTAAMLQRAKWLAVVDGYLNTQAQYFAQLQALAKGDTSSATQKSVKQLAGSLAHVPGAPSLSAAAKNAVAGLAQHVEKARHAGLLAQVLERDADAVGQALLFNQQVLQEQIDWITHREQLARQVEFRDKVQKPFVEGNRLPESWKKTWKAHIKQPPTVELLEQAVQASARMQQAWLDVLRGQGTINELGAVFDELQHNARAMVDQHAQTTPKVQP
jgi:hypothetical protein